ncbi:outer membrane autotransporter barrel protein [Podospora didyma]|uniref:Outer membrane autotransporter barrel protein n=1 Tax=Podospora didyma TaxID=330526 RepID=A0AAE0NYP1_9PEZI|nr:outer membrane autotransporter barrel protein [Podospora didyma]
MAPSLVKLAAQALPLASRGIYTGFTTTALIPWYENAGSGVDWSSNVHVSVRMGSTSGTSYRPIVDTGTQGMVWSAIDMDYDFNIPCADQGSWGWEFLSSSKILYEGCWVTRDFFFNVGSATNPVVKARVPVLAKIYNSTCPTFDKASTTGLCPDTSVPRAANVSGTRMMGIGWGREYDGQPQGTPDKNPLRHIISIGSTTVDTTNYSEGYIIDKYGLQVGLTESNTASMSFYALENHPTIAGEYREARACISIDGATCSPGTAVLDTGIAQSYMRMPSGTVMNRDAAHHLLDNSVVSIRFGVPPPGTPVATESFTVGTPSTPNVNPEYVSAVINGEPTYVNTGRRVYRAFITAFDGKNARYGFKSA